LRTKASKEYADGACGAGSNKHVTSAEDRLRPATAAKAGAKAETLFGASALLALVLPCFFRMSNGSAFLLNSAAFADFVLAALAALLLSGIVLAVVGASGLLRELPAWLVWLGAALFVCGCASLVVAALIRTGGALSYIGGAGFGLGATVCVVAWSLTVAAEDFRGMLQGCAAAFLLGMLLLTLLNNLPPVPTAAATLVLSLAAVTPPLRRARSAALPFPSAGSGELLGVDGELFINKPSFADLFVVLATPILGFMIHTVVAVGLSLDFSLLDASATLIGLAAAAVLALAITRIPWKHSVLPLMYWLLLPVLAALLTLMHNMPTTGAPLNVLTVCVFFFFSLMTLFAVAFLLMVVRQGEFSPLLCMSGTVALVAATSLLGHAVAASGLPGEMRGDIFAPLSIGYFLFLLVMPIAQLWRARRSPHDEFAGAVEQAPEPNLAEKCDALAASSGLSRREREILGYLSQGYNSPYIAQALVISESTVRSHLKSIYRKAGISSRMELLDTVRKA